MSILSPYNNIKEYDTFLLYSTHYNLYYNGYRRNLHVWDLLKNEEILKCKKEGLSFITNLLRAKKYKCLSLVFPFDKKLYGNSPQGLNYFRMKSFIDYLENRDYIDILMGGLCPEDGDFKKSLIIFKSKLMNIIEEVEEHKSDVDNEDSLIEIRDEKGVSKSTKGFRGVSDMRDTVRQYNKLILENDIKYKDIIIPSVMYKRVFNVNLLEGGRWYEMTGKLQSMPKAERSQILIDNEPTIEADYSSLHAMIAYEKEGINLDKSFLPYEPFNMNRDTRNLFKFSLMCCINCDNISQAIGAVSYELGKDKKRKNRKYNDVIYQGSVPVRKICETILNHNNRIDKYLFHSLGRSLQRIDGDMAEYVISYFMQQGELCLPWHDSFIVRESLKEDLVRVMGESYVKVLGSGYNCRIKVL